MFMCVTLYVRNSIIFLLFECGDGFVVFLLWGFFVCLGFFVVVWGFGFGFLCVFGGVFLVSVVSPLVSIPRSEARG